MAMDGGRAAKRQRTHNAKASKSAGSRLFTPHRTLGLVSPTAVPFASVPLGAATFQITTCTGRSLQTYDLRRGLQLVFVTRPQTPGDITASVAARETVYGAWAQGGRVGVWAFRRGRREAELEVPRGWRAGVKALCCFGGWLVGVCETAMLVWKAGRAELYTTLHGASPLPFTGCVSSLPTFLNKLIVGRQDGSAEIWNVSSGKLIYTLLPPSTAHGAVTAIEPTPALSLVAIAYAKGPVLIRDVRTDHAILQLNPSASSQAVTSISFRTDGLGAGEDGTHPGVMATASLASGDITLWDLNNGGRRTGVLRSSHAAPTPQTAGGVNKVHFLPGQHILVTSGLDNALKTWIFDQAPFSPVPRILHQRAGHGAPIMRLDFLPTSSDGSDDTGKWLMTGSRDRSLWAWSLRRDNQSTELSQGSIQSKAKKQGLLSSDPKTRDSLQALKCPPITAMACSLNRDGGIGALPGSHAIWSTPSQSSSNKTGSAEVAAMTGWESVLTAHAQDNKARTWFWGRKRAGRWAFQTSDESPVSAVAMSPCGTFALVGSERGGVDMYNLQSGILRQRFPARLTAAQAKQLNTDAAKGGVREERSEDGKKTFYRGQGRHSSPVVGLAVDNLNSTVISAGRDGKVKFWDFASGLLVQELDWTHEIPGIISMRLQRSSELAAFSCSEGCVRIVDISTRRLIRELWPSRPLLPELEGTPISDICFSPDSSWLAASVGRLILVWDLPTGHLIDAFKLREECTSLGFSPTGEFLATSSQGSVGVDVWSNRSLFSPVPARRISREELAEIVTGEEGVVAPTASGEGGASFLEGYDVEADDHQADEDLLMGDDEADVAAITSQLLTLSTVPRSRWQNLLHLDLIRARNKPVEPPKRPEKAPFFLPSLQTSARPAQADTAKESAADSASASRAEVEAERSRVLKQHHGGDGGAPGAFNALLSRAAQTAEYGAAIEQLKALPPAAADLALRSLSLSASALSPSSSPSSSPGPASAEAGSEMVAFVKALTWLLRERRDFELGQTWMSVFLRLHGDVVAQVPALREVVAEWSDESERVAARVRGRVGYVGGVGGWVRAGRV